MPCPRNILLLVLLLSGCQAQPAASPGGPVVARLPLPLPSLTAPSLREPPQPPPESSEVPAEPLERLPVSPPEADGPPVPLVIPSAEEAASLIQGSRKQVPQPAEAPAWTRHVPPDRSANPLRSVSVGNATTGHLVRGKAIPPEGPGFRVLPRTAARGYHYGTDGLVDALKRSAAAVAVVYPGSVLHLGNLSREGGGDIEPSVSHNSGRDVDLAFYVSDARAGLLDVPRFVRFDADGRSEDHEPPVYFDSRRNWLLIRSLLMEQSVQVQYVFVAHWLEELLLDYAIRADEDPDLVMRAERVMLQPENSSPHAEHFHVRLYCDLQDRLEGCHDFGAQHPWVERFEDAIQARIDALVDMYQSGRPEDRDYALRQLDLLTVVPATQAEHGETPHDL